MMKTSILSIAVLMSAMTFAALPSTCGLDEMYAERFNVGVTYSCRWWVCGQSNQWRLLRDCGTGNSCQIDHPTTCLDHTGKPFRAD